MQQLEKSELERVDLQRKLKAALGGDLAAEQKVSFHATEVIQHILFNFPTFPSSVFHALRC